MQKRWWKEAVVYQVYPRSFKDSSGDGVGDLKGVTEKLDYLKFLGVDVLWLSPVYQSPNDDNGYDISDYQEIMDEFGTLADYQELADGLHARGMKLMMDLVVNHTSDEHRWFEQSRSAKDNPYRDYYFWRPGKDGAEPNNWESFFSGSAWQRDDATGEYYLHMFTKKQADLNWENPKVRQEVYDMMKWWLERGVDGFRMDVINCISKAPGLPDAPKTHGYPYEFPGELALNGPRMLEFLQEMKREVLEPYDVFSVGETPFVTTEHGVALTNEETGPLDMVFNFEHVDIDNDVAGGKWSLNKPQLKDLKAIISRWQKDLEGKGWNSQYLSNHDQPRQVSRYASDAPEHRVPAAKMLGIFLHTLQGTPYIYQGEEIGMTNVKFADIAHYNDVQTLNMFHDWTTNRGVAAEEIMPLVHLKSRDNARTPMQWDASSHAGFTSGTPWLPVNPNFAEINVAAALEDKDSVFYTYKRLIELRKEHEVMVYGSYDLILPEHPEIYAYTRTLDGEKLLVILNFSEQTPTFELPGALSGQRAELLIANYPVAGELASFALKPYEARVYRLG